MPLTKAPSRKIRKLSSFLLLSQMEKRRYGRRPLHWIALKGLVEDKISNRAKRAGAVRSSPPVLILPPSAHPGLLPVYRTPSSRPSVVPPVAAAATTRSLDSSATVVWIVPPPPCRSSSSSRLVGIVKYADRPARELAQHTLLKTFKPAAQELQAAQLVQAVVDPEDLKPRRCRLCRRYLEDHQAHSRPQWDTAKPLRPQWDTVKPSSLQGLKDGQALKFQDASRFLKTSLRNIKATRPRASSRHLAEEGSKTRQILKISTPRSRSLTDFKPQSETVQDSRRRKTSTGNRSRIKTRQDFARFKTSRHQLSGKLLKTQDARLLEAAQGSSSRRRKVQDATRPRWETLLKIQDATRPQWETAQDPRVKTPKPQWETAQDFGRTRRSRPLRDQYKGIARPRFALPYVESVSAKLLSERFLRSAYQCRLHLSVHDVKLISGLNLFHQVPTVQFSVCPRNWLAEEAKSRCFLGWVLGICKILEVPSTNSSRFASGKMQKSQNLDNFSSIFHTAVNSGQQNADSESPLPTSRDNFES
ncbi:hypothetical protein C8F04DRAFT_1172381 [Mycena alexandri]|uniref:Uncharacterized protein n=1 Tax=Mycena alexandri TaxID=1745969 RepID=A0AAD6TL00_9AGAR|nr:hypothetical protein C8F04DRAFT_1172381 [Mycena alexandri]